MHRLLNFFKRNQWSELNFRLDKGSEYQGDAVFVVFRGDHYIGDVYRIDNREETLYIAFKMRKAPERFSTWHEVRNFYANKYSGEFRFDCPKCKTKKLIVGPSRFDKITNTVTCPICESKIKFKRNKP